MSKPVKLFTLSTCSHCRATKELLDRLGVSYDHSDVDLLKGDKREAVIEDMRQYNPSISFPTILIKDKVIIGFREDKIREALQPINDIERLFETLRKIQEPKGFYFNKDKKRVFELLEGLILNKKRYGYMSCPCRLGTGDHEKDKDIICPCIYRSADVKDYGSCYCNLYVSLLWNEGAESDVYVPERRSPVGY